MKSPRTHILQHVSFEGPGCIETWLNRQKSTIGYTRFYESEFQIPSTDDFDLLVVMGGPMGVYDSDTYSWLETEKELIRTAIEHDKTVLGICLGAQLIASALGEDVFPNSQKEIGWFPIFKTETGKQMPLIQNFEHATTVFHWHGDTFNLPAGAQHLFYSEACPNQAFLIKKNVIGLQFHLEITAESLNGMINAVGRELQSAPFIQSADLIRSNTEFIKQNNLRMFELLDNLCL